MSFGHLELSMGRRDFSMVVSRRNLVARERAWSRSDTPAALVSKSSAS